MRQNSINRSNLSIMELRKQCVYYTDCLAANGASFGEFVGSAISSGTVSVSTGISFVNRPGLVRFRSSTTANSGYHVGLSANNLILSGRELCVASLIPSAFANTTTRIGFHDTLTSTDAVDGCYFEIAPTGVVTGKTSNNSIRSSTATNFTLITGTYYTLKIELNNNATLATFTILSESDVTLWTNTLSTNIPTALGRETGMGVISTNSGTTATDLIHLDFLGVEIYPSRG
jgi:hypothetical protein